MEHSTPEGLGVVVLGGDLDTLSHITSRAEAAGFGSVWTTEFYERSATISLAAMAMASERVTIGSAIAYGVGRSPLVLSAEARDIDELSRGRLILGLGTGTRTMQRDWHGADPSAPALRVEELVPLLRRFWDLGPEGIEHDGRFYHVRLRPTADVRHPLRRDIPVYLAGVNPRMVQAAGTVADGLVGHPIFTRGYVDQVVRPALERGIERSGRSRDDVQIAGYVICSIHDDTAVARTEAKAQIAFYSVVRTYRGVLALHGYEHVADDVRAAWAQRDQEAMIAAVPDELVDLIAIAGTPAEARDRFHARFADLYDHPLLYSPTFGSPPGRLSENLDAIVETFGRTPVPT